MGESVNATTAENSDGADQSEGEFGEQRSGQSALEPYRHIDRDQHDGHRDDWPAKFARGLNRGGGRRQPFREMPVDVLHTMIASSTTRPIARTRASSVSRFMEKPNISIIVKAPINDSGIATVGISTERSEPRNTNTTKRYDRQRLETAPNDLADRAVDEGGGVVNDGAGQSLRQLLLDFGKDFSHAGDHVEQVRGGRDLNAEIDRLFAVEADLALNNRRRRARHWRHP